MFTFIFGIFLWIVCVIVSGLLIYIPVKVEDPIMPLTPEDREWLEANFGLNGDDDDQLFI